MDSSRLNAGLFTSAKSDWRTPRALFDLLDREFAFDTDAAANADNALCRTFYGPGSPVRQNALTAAPWKGRCFLNPPYGKVIGEWTRKAWLTCVMGTPLVVALLPARTDTLWFYNSCVRHATEIRFIRGRIRFSEQGSAPFPSAIVIFRHARMPLVVRWMATGDFRVEQP